MGKNSLIIVLTGDLGYGLFDEVKYKYPDRFYNCGSSEQAMMDIACGLAMKGKIPVVYSITPFLIFRAFETIRNYIDHEQLNVKLVGSGRNSDYSHDGFSHSAGDVKQFMDKFKSIQQIWPEKDEDIPEAVHRIFTYHKPYFLSLVKD